RPTELRPRARTSFRPTRSRSPGRLKVGRTSSEARRNPVVHVSEPRQAPSGTDTHSGAVRGVRLTLRTVREALGKTQVEVARDSQIDRADVSHREGRTTLDDCQVAPCNARSLLWVGTSNLSPASVTN